MAENVDSGRLGKAVEHLVAATCILTSGMELNVSTSFVDDEGVDLVFHRRSDSATLAVQVKSRSMTASMLAQKGRFGALVRAATFRPRDDLYLLFVPVDTRAGTYDLAWLVPSLVFAEKTKPNARGRHRFVASIKPDSKDQWSNYRVERAELASRILTVLSAAR